MRKGRFAGLNGRPDAVEPLSLIDLLLVDLLPAGDQNDERIGTERVRSLAHSALFLFASHLCCAGVLIGSALGSDGILALAAPVAIILLLDIVFWFGTRRQRTRDLKPHLIVRFSLTYVLAIGILWSSLHGN